MNKATFNVPVPGFGEVRVEPRGKKGLYGVSLQVNGRHVRRSLKTSNKKTAIERIPLLMKDLKRNQESGLRKLTFEEGLDFYVEYLELERKPPRTIAQVRFRNKAFFDHLRSGKASCYEEIKPIHADTFRADIQNVRSPSTAFGYYRCVKAMLRYLRSRELIHRDPFDHVRYKRPPFRHAVIPDLEQVNAILRRVCPRYIVGISTLAFIGCRREELTRILVKDIDCGARTIHIRRPEQYISKTVTRMIPIHTRLQGLLREIKRPKSGFFFCATTPHRTSNGGKKLRADSLNREFKRAAKSAGLPTGRFTEGGLTLHSLRGFFKTRALLSGVPREVVDTWQGHRGDRSAGFIHYFGLLTADSIKLMDQVDFGE